ncbi:DUF5305 family protein [Actinoplanes sp. M2I2]|uniref:DUF5305 family protein n=1 Tax=Actinoplanes sp. M2I2 TaxID=1734444 RepID=UPI002021AEA3|nr:DUF5305 family protein [Actinoplanes sp. M2I2]
MAVITVMTAIGGWALVTGSVSYVVTSGVSMNPVYYQNDLVIVASEDSYQIGQIAAYHGSQPGQKILHRIVGGDAVGGFILKGDNNASIDPLRPLAADMIGRPVLHVPKGGVWLKPLLSPTSLGMIGFLIISGGATATATRRQVPRGRRKKKVKAMSRQGGSWAQAAEVVKIFERMPPPVRTLAAVVAALTGLALGLAVIGWMRPVVETVTGPAGPSQSTTFSYSTTVPRSAAYDDTTVTSPEPVFRKLVNTVDLRAEYKGPSGTFDLTAELTNGTGWHSTITLIAPQAFTGTTHKTSTTLNLRSLSNRADAASRAIGVQPGTPLTIAVRGRVVADGLPPFTSVAQLQLNEVQLAVADGGSLTQSSGATPATKVQPREIAVFGHEVMNAAAARAYAILTFLLAAAGGVVVFFLTRRTAPLRTREQIERRHPDLLVHVEPMASPPGKPVVNVDNFPALVKLAERYGQMILTWRRPDADDFVVRDEGITYRYRIPIADPDLQNVDRINRPNATGSHRRKASSPVA